MSVVPNTPKTPRGAAIHGFLSFDGAPPLQLDVHSFFTVTPNPLINIYLLLFGHNDVNLPPLRHHANPMMT